MYEGAGNQCAERPIKTPEEAILLRGGRSCSQSGSFDKVALFVSKGGRVRIVLGKVV